MEEVEKMVALKKAYAEIILNTAKEAAARIMVSERKARCFQQDLRSTKDEAIGMLLRLKQMFDAKTTEAENTSLNQQKKIVELEAQLNEAEGMILDLRAELKLANDQLDKVKNNHKQHLNGPTENEKKPYCESPAHEKQPSVSAVSEPFISPPSDARPKVIIASEVNSSPLYQRILDNKCCDSAKQNATSNSQFDNFFVDNPNLASIVMKSKEPELYRNGCTQRIRAIERNLVDEKLPPGDVADQHFLIKSESVIKGNVDVGTCTLTSLKTKNMDILKNQDASVVMHVNTSATKDQPVKICKMRRKTRYRKSNATSYRFCPSLPIKPHQPLLAFPHCQKISFTDNNNVEAVETVCTLPSTKAEKMNLVENSSIVGEKLQHNKDPTICILRRSLRKRKVRYHDDSATSCRSLPDKLTESCKPCTFLSRCKTESINCNVNSGEDRLETESEAKIKTDKDCISVSRIVSVDTKAGKESGLSQNAADEDTDLIVESTLVKQVGGAVESPGDSTRDLNLEVDNVPLADSDSVDAKTYEATDGSPRHADSNRILKYTFSRKRKKESLTTPDESSSLGKKSMKRSAGEILNSSPEPKSSLINESSRDSRRLVQVARQLISLSGKRW